MPFASQVQGQVPFASQVQGQVPFASQVQGQVPFAFLQGRVQGQVPFAFLQGRVQGQVPFATLQGQVQGQVPFASSRGQVPVAFLPAQMSNHEVQGKALRFAVLQSSEGLPSQRMPGESEDTTYLLGHILPWRVCCVGADEPNLGQEELLRVTLGLREVSSGMRLTAASAWFRCRPDRWQAHVEDPPTPIGSSVGDLSSSSAEVEEFESGSTTTGGSQPSLRSLKVISKVKKVSAGIEPRQSQREEVPNGPRVCEPVPMPGFNDLQGSPTAGDWEGVVLSRAPSIDCLCVEGIWGNYNKPEPAVAPEGLVPMGPEGNKTCGECSFVVTGKSLGVDRSPLRVAMMQPWSKATPTETVVGDEETNQGNNPSHGIERPGGVTESL